MSSTVTLLIAEDEPLIVDLLAGVLSACGYEVIAAPTGEAALTEIESDAMRFRALITDIRLGPGPDGWRIAQRAREIVPHLPVVYMSADSSQDWTSKGVPGSIVFAKPFAPAQLATAVSALVTNLEMHAPPAIE